MHHYSKTTDETEAVLCW